MNPEQRLTMINSSLRRPHDFWQPDTSTGNDGASVQDEML
jgi:hypothetical protein